MMIHFWDKKIQFLWLKDTSTSLAFVNLHQAYVDKKIFFANEKNMNAHEIYEKQTRQSKHCGFCINIFIGPESDHWLCLSVTDSLTD